MINVCNELMKLTEKQNYLCMFDTIDMYTFQFKCLGLVILFNVFERSLFH